MNIKKIIIITLALVTSHYSLVTYSYAQQVNLSIDPPIVQAKIKPGKMIVIAYTVQNSGDPTNLQFLIRPFLPQGQLGSLSVLPTMEGPVQFGLENSDITLEKPFFFPSKGKQQAVIRISVPLGIPDGDYYYLVMAETVPAFSLAGKSTGVASATLGSPLLISITESGVTEIKATIADFSFVPDYSFTIGNNTVRIVDNVKPLPIVLSVRNMGKSLIQPEGTITDVNGSIKNSAQIIPQNVLSNSQRVLKVYSDEENGQPRTSITYPHLTVGSHRVTAEVSFGENKTILIKSLSFLALPLRLISVTLFALMSVVGIYLFQRRKKN